MENIEAMVPHGGKMDLTGKQKRFLRARMVTEPAILHIGKGGMNPNLLQQIDDALMARELIKVKMLDTSGLELSEVVDEVVQTLSATHVQTIGNNMVFFRRHHREPKIILPGENAAVTIKKISSIQPMSPAKGRKKATGKRMK